MILQLAKKHNRVVTVVGRSMLNLIAHARNLGYIKCEDSLFQPLHTVRGMPDERVLILTTGSQGETMAAMTRIANKEHPHIKIRPGDTVAFSANPIPGNTIAVVNTIDKLMIQGAKVVYGRDKGIHVVIELTENSIRVSGQVAAGIELVDTSSSGMVSSKVLEERQRMASEGMVTIAAAIDWSGKLMAKPELHMQGVVTSIERSLLQKWVQQRIEEILGVRWLEFSPAGGQPADTDWGGLQETLERELARSMRRELQCQPALTLLMQVPEEPPVKVADGRRRRTRSTAVAS